MFYYSHVYGISLKTNCVIPELILISKVSEVDLHVYLLAEEQLAYARTKTTASNIDLTRLPSDVEEIPAWLLDELASNKSYYVRFDNGNIEFHINPAGTGVVASWRPPLTLADTITYFLGPVIGFILRIRGIVCLHASAVVLAGSAVCFVGNGGAGKSTLAAAFAKEGYPILTDDLAAMDDCGTHFLVQPGYPRLRLWPDSAQVLYGSADMLPRIISTWEKRHLDLTADNYRFQREPVVLRGIYLLDNSGNSGEFPRIEALTAPDTLLALVANTNASNIPDKRMSAHEFDILSRIAVHVSVRRAVKSIHPTGLQRLINLIINDCTSLSAGQQQ